MRSYVSVLITLAACAPPPKPAPDWINKGTEVLAANQGAGPWLCATGMAKNKNAALSSHQAQNFARSEVGKFFAVRLEMMQRRTSDSSETSLKTFSATTLSGVQIWDVHEDQDKVAYARACLDLSTVKKDLAGPKPVTSVYPLTTEQVKLLVDAAITQAATAP